jgi:hypothetical protein
MNGLIAKVHQFLQKLMLQSTRSASPPSRWSCCSAAWRTISWSGRAAPLTPEAPRLANYGALRIVRDLFHIPGLLEFSEAGRILRITLNQAAPLVREIALALGKLLDGEVEIKAGVTSSDWSDLADQQIPCSEDWRRDT